MTLRQFRRFVGLLLVCTVGVLPAGASLAATALTVRPSVKAQAYVVPQVAITGGGWGHSIGMSQYGAFAMARQGKTVQEILTHYYPGTAVSTDTRGSTARIRASLQTGQQASLITAHTGAVEWFTCTPDDPKLEKRAPSENCEPWFTQPESEVLRVRPDAAGVRIERLDSPALAALAEHTQPVSLTGTITTDEPAPLVNVDTAGWTVIYTTTNPIVRAVHGDGSIRAQSQSRCADSLACTTIQEPRRTYRFGWRDYHNIGGSLSVVQDVDTVDHYLRGLAEMPNSWGETGPAALEVQAVTGRTFALRRVANPRGGMCACDVVSTVSDQVFNGEDKVLSTQGNLWADAVVQTADQVLTFNGVLAQTFYSSSHGLGRSENVEDSWAFGSTPISYLRSIDDPWSADPEVNNVLARWTARITNANFAAVVSHGRAQPLVQISRVTVLDRTEGGTPRTLEITGSRADGSSETFVYDGRPQGSKAIAGASLLRFLPVSSGGRNDRLPSQQIDTISFSPFHDDLGSPHEYAIAWAAQVGVVRGIEANRYAPRRAVSRAQMATFLVNLFDVEVGAYQGMFSDVPASNTHALNIEALVTAGVARGVNAGVFEPNRDVTREQMATFITNALALARPTTIGFVDTNGTHAGSTAALAASGITTGCGSQPERFCPRDPVRRDQLATFLYRIAQQF